MRRGFRISHSGVANRTHGISALEKGASASVTRFLCVVALLLWTALDTPAQTVSATVAVGASPVAVAVNPVTNKIYVVNGNSASVTVIDGATNATTTVASGSRPSAVAVNPVTNKIYVANGLNTVTVIDGATNTTTTVAAGTNPVQGAVNPQTNKIDAPNF